MKKTTYIKEIGSNHNGVIIADVYKKKRILFFWHYKSLLPIDRKYFDDGSVDKETRYEQVHKWADNVIRLAINYEIEL